MAFKLLQDDYQIQTRHNILAGSITVKVGDAVVPIDSSGVTELTNATGNLAGDYYPIGIVVGFCKQNGEVISQGQDPANTPNQLTTLSTNLTVDKYHAVYIPITGDMLWKVDVDAAIGTTVANSTGVYLWMDLADCRTLSESSSVITVTGAATPKQFLSFQLDSSDSTNKTVIGRFAKALLIRY